MSNLDSFVKSSRPAPNALATSQEIRDRGSLFVANVYPATTLEEARRAINHLKHVLHGSRRASHEIAAWRCMVLKTGKTGLGGTDDFELVSGSDDDGEKYAGGRVLKVMQEEGVIDAVVIVSRWFGGELLGPARFEHIQLCARDVCRTFRLKDDMAELVATLSSLDDILASLRAELVLLSSAGSSESATALPPDSATSTSRRVPDYASLEESLDIARAKRLVAAREKAIKSVKSSLKARQTISSEHAAVGGEGC